MIWNIIFWFSLFVIVYHLFIYGFLLWCINSLFHKRIPGKTQFPVENLPSITILCPAYNEEKVIRKKIESFLRLDYPADKIKMLVISDDSTDNTNLIVKEYSAHRIELIIQKPRAGKQCAHNLVLPFITSDLILSTDATSIFNEDAVMLLVNKISSDSSIGIVSGGLKIIKQTKSQSGEGFYWRYESFLKKMEDQYKSIIGSSGCLYLIRRELFTKVDPASVDDFERTLIVLERGFLAKYVPEAIVTEESTEFVREELSRKIRIITQEWFAIRRHLALLNPFKHFQISFILVSHKIIRWLLFIFVILMFISSLIASDFILNTAFYLMSGIFLLGIVEYQLEKRNKRIPLANLAAYFVAMTWASFAAFINFIRNKNIDIWKPVGR